MREGSIENVKTDLELDENLDLHETGWKVQRFGWAFIFLFVLLAALGMFGDGIISDTNHSTASHKVNYDRFHRHEARVTLKVDVHNNSNPLLDISLDNRYLKDFEVKSIVPEPATVKIENDRVHFIFEAAGKSDITFYLSPQTTGSLEGTMNINGDEIPIKHFIFP